MINFEKFDELITILNELKIVQKDIDWYENIPDSIWDEHFKENFEGITNGIDTIKYSWHENSISVIKLYGRFLGINHISTIYGENSLYADFHQILEFLEMEEITVISYQRKQT